MTTRDARWFAVHTRPRQEQIAEHHLRNQQFEVFLPRCEIKKRRRHEIVSQVEPYFPRYLFVRFDERRDDWGPIGSTRGVSCLVRFNRRPLPVPCQLISLLRENQNTEGLQELSTISWAKGDKVQIEAGPFTGYCCIFESMRGSERAAVLLQMMNQQTHVVIDSQDLAIPQFA